MKLLDARNRETELLIISIVITIRMELYSKYSVQGTLLAYNLDSSLAPQKEPTVICKCNVRNKP